MGVFSNGKGGLVVSILGLGAIAAGGNRDGAIDSAILVAADACACAVAVEVISLFRQRAMLAMGGVGAVFVDGVGDSRRMCAGRYLGVSAIPAGVHTLVGIVDALHTAVVACSHHHRRVVKGQCAIT